MAVFCNAGSLVGWGPRMQKKVLYGLGRGIFECRACIEEFVCVCNVCIYVCRQVGMYVCVRVYVCMFVWVYVRMGLLLVGHPCCICWDGSIV